MANWETTPVYTPRATVQVTKFTDDEGMYSEWLNKLFNNIEAVKQNVGKVIFDNASGVIDTTAVTLVTGRVYDFYVTAKSLATGDTIQVVTILYKGINDALVSAIVRQSVSYSPLCGSINLLNFPHIGAYTHDMLGNAVVGIFKIYKIVEKEAPFTT